VDYVADGDDPSVYDRGAGGRLGPQPAAYHIGFYELIHESSAYLVSPSGQ